MCNAKYPGSLMTPPPIHKRKTNNKIEIIPNRETNLLRITDKQTIDIAIIVT